MEKANGQSVTQFHSPADDRSKSNEKFNRVDSTLSFQGLANFLDLDQEKSFMYQEKSQSMDEY